MRIASRASAYASSFLSEEPRHSAFIAIVAAKCRQNTRRQANTRCQSHCTPPPSGHAPACSGFAFRIPSAALIAFLYCFSSYSCCKTPPQTTARRSSHENTATATANQHGSSMYAPRHCGMRTDRARTALGWTFRPVLGAFDVVRAKMVTSAERFWGAMGV